MLFRNTNSRTHTSAKCNKYTLHRNLRCGEDLTQVAHAVVNNQTQDAHLCRAALVQLDGALLGLPLLGLLVPAKVEPVAPIATELGGAGAVGVADLEDGAGAKDPKVVGEVHVPQSLKA
jgi:hypothetical protein